MPSITVPNVDRRDFDALAQALLQSQQPDQAPDKGNVAKLAGQLEAHNSWISQTSGGVRVSVPQEALALLGVLPKNPHAHALSEPQLKHLLKGSVENDDMPEMPVLDLPEPPKGIVKGKTPTDSEDALALLNLDLPDPPKKSTVAKQNSAVTSEDDALALLSLDLPDPPKKSTVAKQNSAVTSEDDAALLNLDFPEVPKTLLGNSEKGKAQDLEVDLAARLQALERPVESATATLDRLAGEYTMFKDIGQEAEKDLEATAEKIMALLGIPRSEVEHCLEERKHVKEFNDDHLPGHKLKLTHLPSPEKATSKAQYMWRSLAAKALAHDKGKVRVVNDYSRNQDKGINSISKTKMFDAPQRDLHRVLITDDGFKQYDANTGSSTSFNTDAMESHGKKGFGAFVVTPEGQLYVFNHRDKADGVVHSSLTGGRSVFAAGELRIEDGKLKVLTDHSGHYTPGSEHMARLLTYFANRGIDVSEAVVSMRGDLQLEQQEAPEVEPVNGNLTELLVNQDITQQDFLTNLGLQKFYRADDVMGLAT